jgi:hypothetical protein
MRGRTKEEIHKELQDLDPIGSPHIEVIMIGGNVDLDLLSIFPQKDARIMGGMGRKGKLFKVDGTVMMVPKNLLAYS